MKKYIVIILVLSITQLFSYSILDRYNGNYIDNIDARSSAMGGASVAGGYNLFDSVVNPANITFLDENIGAQIGFGVIKDDDNRSYPMYNFFDGYIEGATYVTNVNYFSNFSGGLYYRHNLENVAISAGLIYRPWVSFDSNYEEQVRNDEGSDFDNYPPIVAKNFIEGEGAINSLGLNLGFNFMQKYSLGLEISSLNGDYTLERRIIWSEYAQQNSPNLVDEIIEYERDYEAITFKIGALAEVNNRFVFGASYAPKVEFDDKAEIENVSMMDSSYAVTEEYYLTSEEALIYPSKIRIGLNYLPRNIFKTYFNADIEIVNWGDVNDLFDTELNYYVGVEHRVNKMIPLRIGFKYISEYYLDTSDEFIYAKKMSWPAFTAGTGFNILDNFVVDLALEYGTREYEALDLFMDGTYNQPGLWDYIVPEDRGWENPDAVKESILKLQTSISYKW